MSTLTAQIKLRRDTEANWTASNPTLAAGEIAISSDILHAGTDQPKFKIGDGSQTWTNLDYYPIGGAGVTPTLAQVLAQDNDTNGLSIVSPDGNSAVAIVDGSITESVAVGANASNVYQDGATVLMSHLGAVESGNVTIDSTQVDNTHSVKVRLNAPAIELTQETASRFVTTDASKNIDTVKTIPTGDVVGTSDSQALTNKTIDGDLNTVQDLAYTVLKTVVGNAGNVIKYNDSTGAPELQLYQGFSLNAFHTTTAPADATTYYWGSDFALAATSTPDILRIYPPKACTLKAVFLKTRCTVGSNEAVGISIRKNNTTTTSIGSIDLSSPATNNLFTGLSITFNGTTDYLEILYDATTWATNPTNLRAYAALYFE